MGKGRYPLRSKRGAPTAASSAETRCETAGWDTSSLRAAAEKDPSSTTVMKKTVRSSSMSLPRTTRRPQAFQISSRVMSAVVAAPHISMASARPERSSPR